MGKMSFEVISYFIPPYYSWKIIRERLTGGFLHAVSHKSSVPY